jgi:ribA/ribD-fused uncharacterized protein
MEKFTLFYSGPFSQWFPCTFTVDGVVYNRTEQYMMHQKALFFGDTEIAAEVMKQTNPAEMKKLGRQVKNFDRDRWNAVARAIVYKGNMAKFGQNPDLLKALLATEGTIVEASPTDKIWGIGLAATDPRANDRSQWPGTNWLGEVLTIVRQDLMKHVCTPETADEE